MLVPILTLVLGITIGVLLIVWLEREISAGIQQRIGPEYASPLGILQALADGTKLLLKENFIHLQEIIYWCFLWIAVSSIAPVGLLMSGYGSDNKYSFLGCLREATQSISYEIPLALCVLSISLLEAQSKYGFWGWNLWRQPIGFIVFLISSPAECERLPFDLPKQKKNYFFIIVTIIYLGGWNLSITYIFVPELFGINKRDKVYGTLIGIFITLAKTYLFLFIPIATRWTLPRLRMDQLLNLGWKFLLPISLGNLLLKTSSQLLSL
ncbi:unnamed protein product [Withania somnifera]